MEGVSNTRLFGVTDYIVFGSIILISLLLGIFFAILDKRRNTSVNYFLGNKKQKALPLGVSYVVTFLSSIIFLGTPAEIYLYGIQYVVQLFGTALAFILSAVIAVPLYHPLGITSCYEYYYLRYGSNLVRYVGVMQGIMYFTLYMGVVLNGAALALQSTAGLPTWLTIVVFSVASITYTSLGGMKAVIWTDVFQSFIMLAGMIAVLTKILTSIGGIQALGEVGQDRLKVFDFSIDPTIRHTFWSLTIGAVPQFFYIAITQAGIQRILSTPDMKTAKRVLYIAAPVYCLIWFIAMFEGISVFAYFKSKRCDPIVSGQIDNSNQIIPFVMLELFHNYPGIPGLFIAALAAACLSTISSGLSGLAAVVSMDILRVVKPNISDASLTQISKLFVVLMGSLTVAFAFVLSNVKGPLGQIMAGLTGAVAGPETGMFLVSVFFRRSRPKAVVFAVIIVLILSLWLILGQSFSPGVTQAPYLPLAPTDTCRVLDNSTSFSNAASFNYSLAASTPISNISMTWQTSTPDAKSIEHSISVLDDIYSLSYMYIHLFGTILTIVIAVIGSLITQPKQPEPVNEKCVLSFRIFIPSYVERLVSRNEKASENGLENTGEKESML